MPLKQASESELGRRVGTIRVSLAVLELLRYLHAIFTLLDPTYDSVELPLGDA